MEYCMNGAPLKSCNMRGPGPHYKATSVVSFLSLSFFTLFFPTLSELCLSFLSCIFRAYYMHSTSKYFLGKPCWERETI